MFALEAFGNCIFGFDQPAADTYGEISAKREKAGFNVDAIDLMIAAFANSIGASIATHNENDFQGCSAMSLN